MPFYAVQNGRSTGVYTDWQSCKNQVDGFKGAVYKKFNTAREAASFAGSNSGYSFSSKAKPKELPIRTADVSYDELRKQEGKKLDEAGIASRYEQRTARETSRDSGEPRGHYSRDRSPGYRGVSSGDGSSRPTSGALSTSQSGARDQTTTEPSSKEIYVDGACRGNGKSRNPSAGYGVYYGPNDVRNLAIAMSAVDDLPATNQRAELFALRHALRDILGADSSEKFTIRSDSQYSIKALREWLPKWERNGWKTGSGVPVKNKELIEEIVNLDKKVKKLYADRGWGTLELKHVAGHQGHWGNEEADRLANEGADLDEKWR